MKKIVFLLGPFLFINQIFAQCTVPTLVSASPASICVGGTVNLTATSSTNSISWYTVPVGGVSTGTSASGANFSVSPAVTTTYYAESFGGGGAGPGTLTLNYTGSNQPVVIPPGVFALTITVSGAQGATAMYPGANGGTVKGILACTPGQVLNVFVGGAGAILTGGYNGGGAGGGLPATTNGGGGGGASDIRLGGVALTDRIIVGAGGGGSGNNYSAFPGTGGGGALCGAPLGYGGQGGQGCATGANGGCAGGTAPSYGTGGGGGGLSSGAPTAGSSSGVFGTAGVLGVGGDGGNYTGRNGAGGGGGGYYGGAGGMSGSGGCNGGGGGGSSYADNSKFSSIVFTAGNKTGNGQVLIEGLTAGCVSASRTPVTVTVNPLPVITANSGTICPGQSFTITPGGAFTYTIQGGSSVVSPLVNSSYTVRGTSAAGCVSAVSATANVTVAPNPTVSIGSISPSNTICAGTSATIIPSGATSYTLNPGGLTGVSFVVTPLVNTTYSINGASSFGCASTNTTTQLVNVVPAPTLAIVSVSSNSICLGTSVVIKPTGVPSYTLNPGGFTSAGADFTVTPLATTIYTLTGSLNASCLASNSATTLISVDPLPTVSIVSIVPGNTICSTQSVVITPTGASIYTLTPGLIVGTSFTVSPLVFTNYSIRGASPYGCISVNTATTSITVNTTPTVALGAVSSNTICLGGAVTIFPSGSTGYVLEPGSLTGSSFTLNPSVSTTYSIAAISALGCISNNTVYTTITVNPKPVVGFASITNTNICLGSLSVITPSGAATYTLMPGGLTGISFIVTPTVGTTYTITGLDVTAIPSCTNLAVTSIAVVPPILPTIAASSPTICLTRTLSLIGSPNIPGYTYAWTPVASILGSANTYSAAAKPLGVGTTVYTLAVSNGTCTEYQTVPIGVIKCSVPVLTFTTITSNSICTNGCVTFSASATGTPQPISYEWVFENGNPSAATTSTAQSCYTLAGTYSISIKATNDFGSDSIIKLKYVEVTDMPTVVTAFGDTTLKIGQVKHVWATGSKYYHWYPSDGVACPTCSMTTVQPSVTTEYIVIGSNSSVCSLQDTVLIKVDFVCGDFFVPNAFSPNGDGRNDMVNVHGFCIKNYKFQIFNRWGEMVFETTDKNLGWDGNYRGKPMDTGVFIYRAEGETIDGKPFSIKGNITLLR